MIYLREFFILIFLITVSSTHKSWVELKGTRPDAADRKFVSTVIDAAILNVKAKIRDQNLATLFENSYPNSLDTTVKYYNVDKNNVPDSFVITGDIDAMWLRDSSNQVLTYKAFFNKDAKLKSLVLGVIRRQISQILLDPFANAFNFDKEGSDFATDYTTRNFFGIRAKAMIAQLHERKFEIDSLASVIRLQNVYYQQTQDKSFVDFNYFKSLLKIIIVLRDMQNDQTEEYLNNRTPYTFSRLTYEPTDTVCHRLGYPCKHTGLIRSFFRPSDDSTLFQFNIPCNAFVSSVLFEASQMLESISSDPRTPYFIRIVSKKLQQQAYDLSVEIRSAIYKYGLSPSGDYFMYEVDGFGNGVFMDDANQPSLLGLPLYNFIDKLDPIYMNTRMKVLSEQNPYYFSGKAARGIGGPHVGIGYIWPMSIITQAMTSNDKEEIRSCLYTIVATTADTYFIHESFQKDDPNDFTRVWFAWANGLFGELVMKINNEMPDLLQ